MQEATRLQPATLKWAAGSKLAKGEVSQEDYKRVIQGEISLDEAVRRVMDGEVESAIAVQRRKAENRAAERRAALKEERERMTETTIMEAQEEQVSELTIEPVEEDQGYEEIVAEEPTVEEPKWDVVVIQPDGTAEVVDELGGKLADAKKRGQQIYDENGEAREVRVRAYADEKTKKIFMAKKVSMPVEDEAVDEAEEKNREAAEKVLEEAQAVAGAQKEPEKTTVERIGTGTQPTDPNALANRVTIGRNGTGSVYIGSRTTIPEWRRLAREQGAAESNGVDVAEILERKLHNIKVYDARELEALIVSSRDIGQKIVGGEIEASKAFAQGLMRLSAGKLSSLRPYFT